MSDDPITARLMRQAMPVFTILASCLLVVTIASMLYFGRDIIVPVVLAILLSFVLVPAVRVLRRAMVPRAAAAPLVVVAAFAAIIGVGLLITTEAGQLASDLPRYQITIREKIASVKEATSGSGTLSRIVDMVQDLGEELQPAAPKDEDLPGRSGSRANPLHVVVATPQAALATTLGAFVGPILHPLATAGLILLFTIFILLQREDLRNRAIRLAGSGDLRRTTAAIDDATSRLSRFFLAQLALNIAFGAVIGTGLWFIGVPSPILFGVLAAILRFVPYIGGAISALLPLILAAAVDPGWSMVIATALLSSSSSPSPAMWSNRCSTAIPPASLRWRSSWRPPSGPSSGDRSASSSRRRSRSASSSSAATWTGSGSSTSSSATSPLWRRPKSSTSACSPETRPRRSSRAGRC